MIFVYKIFISVYACSARLLSLFNPKAKKWLSGRTDIFHKLKASFKGNEAKVVWIHCASLGEFEQARPIIELLALEKTKFEYGRGDKQKLRLLLTFFSPSGYEIQKNYDKVDWVFYLPVDTKKNAEQFYKIVNPALAIFVKYEFWYYYYTLAKQKNIPLISVSTIFRENQPFFKWYGSLHRKMLNCVTHFFVQSKSSSDLLYSLNIKDKVSISGDTRFDRVIEIANSKRDINEIEKFIGENNVIVAGSTWTEDDEEIDHFANTNPDIKFIVAPHEITKDRLYECLRLYHNSVLFSQLNKATKQTNVVVIDNIGMLSRLYSYATISYVGGGFGNDGVHNVLEPAVYGKPVIFGNVYDKFQEAIDLIECGGAISIENALEFEKVVTYLLNDKSAYHKACTMSKKYVYDSAGASQKVFDYIKRNYL